MNLTIYNNIENEYIIESVLSNNENFLPIGAESLKDINKLIIEQYNFVNSVMNVFGES